MLDFNYDTLSPNIFQKNVVKISVFTCIISASFARITTLRAKLEQSSDAKL